MAYVNEVYQWEGDTSQPYEETYTWKSKAYMLPVRTTFTCGRLLGEFQDRETYWALVEARNQAIMRNRARIAAGALLGMIGDEELGERELDGDILEDVAEVAAYSGDLSCTLNVYVDDSLKFSKEVYIFHPFRLGDGFRGRTWEIEVIGNIIVKRIDLASSMEELKQLIQATEEG
jgi:hypothetical protein